MKILVTGAGGFIGKNIIAELKNRGLYDIYKWTRHDTEDALDHYTKDCDMVFHVAGVNRSPHEKDFMDGNYGVTSQLVESLQRNNNPAPIIATSSIQASERHPYGQSKKAMEKLLFDYSIRTGNPVYIYRLPNVFGKWSRPHYNSVVATFCYQLARDLPITVDDSQKVLTLAYIDDVVAQFLQVLHTKPAIQGDFCELTLTYELTVGQLAEKLRFFQQSRQTLKVANIDDELTKKLYSTYMSFLPKEQFAYDLPMHVDERGSFAEFLRTTGGGQISVNVSKPGVTKGNHWHHTKLEKFLVVSGEGVIRFRRWDSDEVIEYEVSGEKLQVVDIPAGYTHSLINRGNTDLITVIWANECFDPVKPDTYHLEV